MITYIMVGMGLTMCVAALVSGVMAVRYVIRERRRDKRTIRYVRILGA